MGKKEVGNKLHSRKIQRTSRSCLVPAKCLTRSNPLKTFSQSSRINQCKVFLLAQLATEKPVSSQGVGHVCYQHLISSARNEKKTPNCSSCLCMRRKDSFDVFSLQKLYIFSFLKLLTRSSQRVHIEDGLRLCQNRSRWRLGSDERGRATCTTIIT